ncbi:chitooligosaccharidolytic beta-N-acetylglucosaminidase-like [Penaeus japonicus]|uniref:chitooligosaccharidolytic beta-N-acetylglucosaminidase-like n=1 Tax=Penaeus japonicus TaxID=27405 RepID=UPI001C70DE4A|nr:chitooligosaccharidolytic beta-N-acetylglucosaminidase-like [Penaeus japonicus]
MKVFVAAALLALAAAEGYFRLPNPYSYSCLQGLCVKQESTQTSRRQSLGACQITCGQYGSIWPQPTGEVRLSRETVSFSPLNVRVTKAATSDKRVARMLDSAIQQFTRNIHFLHPDYPQVEKQPLTPENFEYTRRFDQEFQREESTQQYRQRSEDERDRLRQRPSYSREEPESFIRKSPFLRERSNPGVESQNVNIEITVTAPDHKLRLDTDESYNLVIQTVEDETTVTILATTYYGARHALETLSQLIAYDDINNAVQIVRDVQIRDAPSFRYRGFMLDTARNFYPKEDLMKLLDSMAYNKLNYFHWHINDAASFPMYSSRLPRMTYYGAYDARKVYYPEDIRDIVEFANLRGITVIPELGGPAHNAAGWQWAEKEGKGKLALCTDSNEQWFELSKEPPAGQMNPVNPELYPILGELYRDLMDYFDPEMVHMGGDDVSFKCWQSSEEIQQYLSENKLESTSREYFELWNYYQRNAYAKLQEAAQGRKVTPIIYSSSFARNYISKDDYIFQISESANESVIADYVKNGFRVIFSNQDQWNLGCITNTWVGDKAENCPSEVPTWENFYRNSPLDMLEYLGVKDARSDIQQTDSVNLRNLVLGGEATLWSFDTDANGLQSKVWPRLSAFAERLWTDPQIYLSGTDSTQKRLNIQRLRMVYRGISADPLQPEFCLQDESACFSREQFRARSGIKN